MGTEKIFFRSCRNQKCIPNNNQHYCFFDEELSRDIFFWTPRIFGMWIQQLLHHSTTPLIGIFLRPFIDLKKQFTILSRHIWCSPHCDRCTLKEGGCVSPLNSLRRITYSTDEWTKQMLRLKSWELLGILEPLMKFLRLWCAVVVLKWNHFLWVLQIYCLLVQ